ncbi:MAG: DNA translocase FtsK 4TM domain-containing protein, partial [Patescibacteria group bacterium]
MARPRKHKEHLIPKPSLNLSPETKKGLAVVLFVALFLITLLSLFGKAGVVGEYISNGFVFGFGYIAYLVPVIFLLIGIALYKQSVDEGDGQHFYFRTYLGAFILAGSLAGLIHIFYMRDGSTALDLVSKTIGGGYLGALFGYPFFSLTGFWAALVILIGIMITGLLITFDVSLSKLIPSKTDSDEENGRKVNFDVGPIRINSMGKNGFVSEKVSSKNRMTGDSDEEKAKLKTRSMEPIISAPSQDRKTDMPAIILDDRKDWKLPPFDLLEDSTNTVDSGNIEVNVSIIQKTLSDFGIEVEMGEVNVGPTV